MPCFIPAELGQPHDVCGRAAEHLEAAVWCSGAISLPPAQPWQPKAHHKRAACEPQQPADLLHAQLPIAVGTMICLAQRWPRLQTSPVSKREALYLQFSKNIRGTQVHKTTACWEPFADHTEHGMPVVQGLYLQTTPYCVLPWDYWVL